MARLFDKNIILSLLFLLPQTLLFAGTSLERKKNILFIIVDDLRPELGCYGKTYAHTPNIDKLASKSFKFNNAYVQYAKCHPSRTSMLTGLRTKTLGIKDLRADFRDKFPDVVTLPQHFKNNGYFTLGYGKIYHQGIEDPLSWTDSNSSKVVSAKDDIISTNQSNVRTEGSGPAFMNTNVKDNAFEDGRNTDIVINKLKELKEKPFFLGIGFIRPHLPFAVPKRYWDFYNDVEIPEPDFKSVPFDSPAFAVNGSGELKGYDGIPNDTKKFSVKLSTTLRKGYLASISYVDAQIGKILNQLESLGLDKNTIIVLTSDHGFKLGEYNAWAKDTNFDIDLKVPLIIYDPDKPSTGQSVNGIVELVDLYPTLSDMAGLSIPDHLEGKSFHTLMDHPRNDWKYSANSWYVRKVGDTQIEGLTWKTSSYRYTYWKERWRTKIFGQEYYDHVVDRNETNNLWGKINFTTREQKLINDRLRGEFDNVIPFLEDLDYILKSDTLKKSFIIDRIQDIDGVSDSTHFLVLNRAPSKGQLYQNEKKLEKGDTIDFYSNHDIIYHSSGEALDQFEVYISDGIDQNSSVTTIRIGTEQDFLVTNIKKEIRRNVVVYPNPTNDILYIEGGFFGAFLFDFSGKLILKTDKSSIDLSKYKAGIYYLKIYNAETKDFKSFRVAKK